MRIKSFCFSLINVEQNTLTTMDKTINMTILKQSVYSSTIPPPGERNKGSQVQGRKSKTCRKNTGKLREKQEKEEKLMIKKRIEYIYHTYIWMAFHDLIKIGGKDMPNGKKNQS